MGDLGLDELRLMQGLAQHVMSTRLDLVNGDATVGELAWVWARNRDEPSRSRLWFTDGRLTGWGWAFPDGDAANLIWQVRPDSPELLTEILDWYDEVAGDVDRRLTVQCADASALALVAAHGYEVDTDNDHWVQFNERELTDLPDPVLPSGFRFRTAEDVSVEAAVQAHRDAWPRSSLTPEGLSRVQQTWPYRSDLHVLVEAPDGRLAATAIMWLDLVTRTAEFEPVGTHQEFRRLGLGTALQLHGMRLARAAGADRMLVACLGSEAHPAARGLYYGVGFRAFTRDLPQVKRRSTE